MNCMTIGFRQRRFGAKNSVNLCDCIRSAHADHRDPALPNRCRNSRYCITKHCIFHLFKFTVGVSCKSKKFVCEARTLRIPFDLPIAVAIELSSFNNT
ncbi:hypothetical protein D3C80_1508810 [compost metagenome]